MGKQQGRQDASQMGGARRTEGRPQGQQGGDRKTSASNDGASRQQQQQNERQEKQNVHGEGNYAASRQYNKATKDFVDAGRVEPAARAAEPRSDADADEMAAAEAEGKRHAKGEDPALNRKGSQQQLPESRTPRPGEDRE
jgi:hypothetical protein